MVFYLIIYFTNSEIFGISRARKTKTTPNCYIWVKKHWLQLSACYGSYSTDDRRLALYILSALGTIYYLS